jgi:hypothetical protein
MAEPREYRVRVGRMYFDDAHYVTAVTPNDITMGPVDLCKPKTWKQRPSVQRHMARIQKHYPSAEVELRYMNEE